MNRRDFLFFRTSQKSQIVELSCERLYMRYLDSQSATPPAGEGGIEPWEGEPAAALTLQTTGELFADLERRLQDVDVLRIVDQQWLAAEDFRREVERVVAAFRARGGSVE